MNFKRFAAPLLVAAALAPAAAAAEEDKKALLDAAGLRADVAILRRAYEALHPGLYRYNTAAQMDAAFRALEQELSRDRTLAEAYLAFSVFAAKVRCGHTYANFYNQRKAVQQELFEAGRLPFYFRWLGDRMIVTRSFANDPRLAPGTEVLAIGGTPAAQILKRLLTVARADGNNEAKRRSYLEVQGSDRFAAFDIFFPLFFPTREADFLLRIRGPEGESEIRVPPQSPAARRDLMAQAGANPEKDGPLWELSLLEDRLAHLRMPTWALYNSSWDWKAFLAETFESLEKSGVRDLVVDLRGNEGGVDVGDVIVSHLIRRPVPRQVVHRRVRYRQVPVDLLPYLDTWDPTFKDWGQAATEDKDGFYKLRRDADDDPGSAIAPASPTFSGRLWVLVGAANSSATFEFAQTVRQNGLGTLVGQSTGGNQRGINGGAFFFLRLPNSNIELDLPLIGQFPAEDKPDAGLEPDILVEPTAEDLAAGRDAELAAVRAALAAKRPPV
jgi:hypothetical protein